MKSGIELVGLEAFRAALRNLPAELASEGSAIVQLNAEEARRRTVDAYPVGPTGNLRRGVTMSVEHDTRFGVKATVRSRAKHSHLFEHGTGQRRTSRGWNRGRMPEANAAHQMIPIVIRRRRIMVEALKDLVRKAGFQVA